MACSRPAPGPLTFTSTSTIPLLRACCAAFSAARPAAYGVLLRAPLKNPPFPADAHAIVSPFVSVIVTIVLLNVALMCAIPRVTPLRIFFFAAAFAPPAGLACSPIAAFLFYADRRALRPTRYTSKTLWSGGVVGLWCGGQLH